MNLIIDKNIEALINIAQKETKLSKENILLDALGNYIDDIIDSKSALEAEKRIANNANFIDLETLAKKAGIDIDKI